ncbi:hypothetical protein SH139x_004172 [Planctomycetaceae bacterium SH139]
MNKKPDDPTLKLPALAGRLVVPMMAGGALLLVLGVALGAFTDAGMSFAMGAYLTAFTYCLTIALGALFFVLIQHLTRAGWSVTVRRVGELFMYTLPVLGLLFLPVLATLFLGEGTIYKWDDPAWVETHHPEWQENAKGFYLTDWFFALRSVLYLGVWAGLAVYFFKASRQQDQTAELRITEKLQTVSAPAVILFSLTLTFAAFDWIMSLEPIWFSTMFGVYIFAGGILSSLCAILVMVFLVQRGGALRQEVTVEHYHDLGKLIFGFITFWTYIAFSQYMLIWYANIPEETFWFMNRQTGGWAAISILLPAFHWLLPFLGTMSRHVRRRPGLMFFWASYILVVHFIDIYWLIMPTLSPANPLGGGVGIATTLLCLFGMSGLLIGVVLRAADNAPLIPVRDPRLNESLAFHNM